MLEFVFADSLIDTRGISSDIRLPSAQDYITALSELKYLSR